MARDNDGVFNISKISQSDTSKPSMATGGASPTWSTHNGKFAYGASGTTEVLLITSNLTTQDDDVVQRRPGGELKDDERRKLEHQGVPRDCHHDDLSIMRARYGLDKKKSIAEVLRDDGSLTCEQVTKKITQLMNNTETCGGEVISCNKNYNLNCTICFVVILYYAGPGKKGTGDWCFSDGFISFRDIMHLYLQNAYFKGKLLYVISDCSYSGCWVKEAMSFLDEHGVGPCGHTAKEKGILVKVLASCLANEVPAELAFSTRCAKNDKNTGTVLYDFRSRGKEIRDGQHTSGLDFTAVQCKSKIDEPCTRIPGLTWKGGKIIKVTGEAKGRPVWHYVLVDEETIKEFFDKMKEGNFDVADYGQVLKSGWGQEPPEEVQEWIKEHFQAPSEEDYKSLHT